MVPVATTTASTTVPPALPPSVEEAYRRKCVELRRRMLEVQTNNDALRTRQIRLSRGVMKMRFERSVLLEALKKRMKKEGINAYNDDSEDSSGAPPTPQERPLRVKKSHRRLLNESEQQPTLTQQLSAASNQPSTGPLTASQGISIDQGTVASIPAESSPGPTAQPTSTSSSFAAVNDLPHPPPPKAMYTATLRKQLNSDPNLAAEVHENYKNDLDAYAEDQWRSMDDTTKNIWTSKYNEEMVIYEKAMDEKKRLRRKRNPPGSEDVKMED